MTHGNSDFTYFMLNHTANLWDEVLGDDAV